MQIHVLGAGAVGLFYSFHIEKHFPRTILLVQRKNPQNHTLNLNQQIDLTFETIDQRIHNMALNIDGNQENSAIKNLLVTTKAQDGVEAIETIIHRISNGANIILLSNGVLKLLEDLYKIPGIQEKKLNFYLGMTSHGIVIERNNNDNDAKTNINALEKNSTTKKIIHKGLGTTHVGPEKSHLIDWDLIYRLKKAFETTNLGFQFHSTFDSVLKPIELKLGVNAILNPLTAILNTKAGIAFSKDCFLKELCEEVASVLPTISDPHSLYDYVLQVARLNLNNHNTMQVDISLKRKTEIDFLNGYLDEKAVLAGLKLPRNHTLLKLIRMKEELLGIR